MKKAPHVVNLYAGDEKGYSAIHYAAEIGTIEIFAKLHAASANLQQKTQSSDGLEPITVPESTGASGS